MKDFFGSFGHDVYIQVSLSPTVDPVQILYISHEFGFSNVHLLPSVSWQLQSQRHATATRWTLERAIEHPRRAQPSSAVLHYSSLVPYEALMPSLAEECAPSPGLARG